MPVQNLKYCEYFDVNEKYLKYFDYHADFYQKCDDPMIYISDATCHGVPVLTAVIMPVRYSE